MSPSTRPVRHLLLALVFITQVPAVLTMGALLHTEYLRQRDVVSDEMVDRARNIAMAVRERLDQAQARLENLAQEVPASAEGMPAFYDKALQLQAQSGLDAITLVRHDGQQVMNTRVALATPLPRANPDALTPFRAGGKAILDLNIGSVSRAPLVGVGVPVVRDSRIAYALNAAMDATRFRDLLVEQKLPDRWMAAVIDTRGAIIGRIPNHEEFVGRHVSPDLYDRIRISASRNSSFTVFESHIDGIDAVTAMRRSPVNGWSVVVSVPNEVLNAPVWLSAAWLSAIFVLVLVSSVTAALFISGHIASCIGRLRDAAAALPRDEPLDLQGLCFAEARQLGDTLEQARTEIAVAHAEVQRISESFQRTLMHEIETRQAQIARELHDSVGSSLAGVSMLVGNARAGPLDPKQALLLEKAQQQVQLTSEHVRAISRGMTPAGTEAGGLLAAIEQFAADLTRFQRVRCTVRARGRFHSIPPSTATHLYRIVQEATTNAIRHGGAKTIRISLAQSGESFRLAIRDDGHGTNFGTLPVAHPGMGLRSMRARARAIDAGIEFRSLPGRGCRVRVSWRQSGPLRSVNSARRPAPSMQV